MTNEELVAEIKAGKDVKENLEWLWRQNKGFVAKKVNKYRFYAEFEDLMQEGYLGLCYAVEKYDSWQGALFITFASYCLDTVLSRYISKQNTIRLPLGEYALVMKYDRVVNRVYACTGRKPTREEMKEHLGVGDAALKKIERNHCILHTASLDGAQSEDEDFALEDVIADKNNDIERAERGMYIDALKETIWKTVDTLPTEQREIIHQRYEQGMSYKEIEEKTGTDRGKVWRIENNAFRTLRSGRNGKVLRALAYGKIYNGAVQENGLTHFNRTHTSSTERVAMDL